MTLTWRPLWTCATYQARGDLPKTGDTISTQIDILSYCVNECERQGQAQGTPGGIAADSRNDCNGGDVHNGHCGACQVADESMPNVRIDGITANRGK